MNKKIVMSLVTISATMSLHAANIEELNAKFDTLSESILDLQENTNSSSVMDKVSIGGYGKMDYVRSLDTESGSEAKLDIYRFIMYLGYQFSDDVKFVSELEWEHGGREKTGGYGIVEQAYLDFKLNDMASLKLGHMIVPVGMVNLYHEPTFFNAVNRPEVEKYIIPSTWHENGAILHGEVEGFAYQVGAVAGLNANNGSKIRDMRQHGQKSKADDLAGVARVDYKGIPGLLVGASIFSGGAAQGTDALDNVSTTVAEVHAGFNFRGFNIRGLYAINQVDGASEVAKTLEKDATGEGSGFYINAAYDVNDKITPFVRYEKYNVFDEKYDSLGTKIASDKDTINTVIGLNYKPTRNVVIKADYMIRDNKGKDDNRFELGTGYVF